MKLSLSYLITIYGIVGTILSSFFIFVMIEGLRDKQKPYKIKIFFNESKLITIIILFFLFLIFLPFHEWYQITLTAFFIALFGFVVFGIYAICQIVLITLNSEELWKRHINLFRSRIKEATKFIIEIKLKNNDFLNMTHNKRNQFLKLKHSYPTICEEKNMLNLKSNKKGTIIDIDLNELKSIFNKINKKFKKVIVRHSKSSEILEEQKNTIPEEDNEKKSYKININFCVQIGHEMKKNDFILFHDNKKNDHESDFQKINNIIEVRETTIVDEVKLELEDFKSMMIKFIKSKNIFQFERYFNLYFDLVEEFLNEFSKYEKFSYQDAKKQRNIVPTKNHEGWPPLTWLREHIMDLFRETKNLKPYRLYNRIQWFTYDLIVLSLEKDSHLLFQESLFLWEYQFYLLSKDEKLSEQHITFFKEHLMPVIFENRKNIKENSIPKEKEGYAIFLLEIIKNILFEHSLKKDRDDLLSDLKEILKNITTAYSSKNIFSDSIELNYKKINNSVFELPESYESRKFQFFFGVGAYLDNLKRENLEGIKETVKSLIPGIAVDLKSYAKIYQLMCETKIRRFWNWDFLYGESLRQIRDSSHEQIIAHYLLKLMSDIPEWRFNNLVIEKLEENVLSGFSDLFLTLNDLDIDENKKDKIQNFLKHIFEYQSKKKIEILTKVSIDKDKIKDFIQNFQRTFLNHSDTRKIFECKQKNQHKNKKNEVNSIIFQMNNVNEKLDFIANTDTITSTISFAPNMGSLSLYFSSGFIKGENKFLQSEILNRCEKIKVSYDKFKQKLINKKWDNNEKLLLSANVYNQLSIDSYFKDKKVPFGVYYMHKESIGAVIIDVSKLPTLEMFDPVEPEKELFEFQFLPDIGISVGIEAFSHNEKLMEFILKNPPDWLIEKGDEKAQRDYLNQRVNIKILQGLYLNWEGIEEIGEAFVITD